MAYMHDEDKRWWNEVLVRIEIASDVLTRARARAPNSRRVEVGLERVVENLYEMTKDIRKMLEEAD